MLNREPALDLVFHALAHPTRRAILERLSCGPASVSELAAPMPMSLAAVMQHLQVLQASRLVHTEKQGRVRVCTVDSDMVARAEKWFSDRRRLWETRLDRLAELLTEDRPTSKKSRRSKT